MATPDQESVDTFMSITGSSELVAIRKLTEHHGVLNEAVNSYFTEGDANIRHETNAAPQHNSMDTDETDGAFHESHHADIASGTGDVTSTLPEIIPETRVTSGTDDDVLDGISRDTCAAPSALVSLSVHDEAVDAEEQPLVRRRRRRVSSTSGPTQQQNWGGISSEEQEEAVMLEAAMFGGVSERAGYARNYYMRNGLGRTNGPYTRSARARVRAPRPPSPSLTAQRLIREQQDNEYHAALQADKEKELLEQAAREAAMEEEQRKLEQEQEMERQLAVKEASLPQEPASGDENAVTLLVRMPDGSRRGRRFLKTNKLQCLFDFIDVGRVVKPSTYRLVRPYPKRSFGDGENGLTLHELGLSSKQEALFLELI